MTNKIKVGDLVKIISGDHKGKTAKVVKLLPKENAALLEGIGLRTRHMKPTQLNPKGGKKEIHTAVNLSKIALVIDEKTGLTSRVGFSKNEKGETVRVARKANNREIK
jgi:large subunit ribosomal protein L24